MLSTMLSSLVFFTVVSHTGWQAIDCSLWILLSVNGSVHILYSNNLIKYKAGFAISVRKCILFYCQDPHGNEEM